MLGTTNIKFPRTVLTVWQTREIVGREQYWLHVLWPRIKYGNRLWKTRDFCNVVLLKNLKEKKWWSWWLFLFYTRLSDIDGNNHSQFMLYFKTGLCDINTLTAEILTPWTALNSGLIIPGTDNTELFVVLFKCSCKYWSQISHILCYTLFIITIHILHCNVGNLTKLPT